MMYTHRITSQVDLAITCLNAEISDNIKERKLGEFVDSAASCAAHFRPLR